MNLATVICIGLLLVFEGSQAQLDPGLTLTERCRKVSEDFQHCARKAHAEYSQAMAAGGDGREAYTARKACNYITDSVENCGKILVGECHTVEQVREMKEHQIGNYEYRLSSRDESWDSEKCPVVKDFLDRKRAREGGDDVIAQEQTPPPESEPEEVSQAATIEEQVSSLRNETQTKRQTLTRLEAFFEELERRILRLETANNGTRGVTESVQESMTSPAPETTTNLPCCHKIKLKSRNTHASIRPFLGVYVYNKLDEEDLSVEVDFEVFYYAKFSEGRETLSNACQNNLAGFNSIHDECGEEKLKFESGFLNFESGFTGSCITGPKLYTVHWYNERQDTWEENDSLSIVCVE